MPTLILDPDTTEKLLLDAGFIAEPLEMGFMIRLVNRRVTRGEVAVVLGCEPEDLTPYQSGVLLR